LADTPCKYVPPDDPSLKCKHSADEHGEWCIFHKPNKSATKDPHEPRDPFTHNTDSFSAELQKLVLAEDLNWTGFRFPYPIKISRKDISRDIDLVWGELPSLTVISAEFRGRLNLVHCNIAGPVIFYKCEVDGFTDFSHRRFHGDFIARGRSVFHGDVCFANAHFLGSIYYCILRSCSMFFPGGPQANVPHVC